jgi:hypothetical protein
MTGSERERYDVQVSGTGNTTIGAVGHGATGIVTHTQQSVGPVGRDEALAELATLARLLADGRGHVADPAAADAALAEVEQELRADKPDRPTLLEKINKVAGYAWSVPGFPEALKKLLAVATQWLT